MKPALPAALLSLSVGATAQPAPTSEFASIEGLMQAFYTVMAGPAGAPRDWARMRAMFLPDARMISVGPRPDGTFAPRVFTVEEYIARATPIFQQQGYVGREVARHAEAFGQMVVILSTFEARHAPTDPKPIQRGLNSLQVVHDGQRYWIANLVWQSEDPSQPLPARYLGTR